MGELYFTFFYVFMAYVKCCGIDGSVLFGLFVKKYKIGCCMGCFLR
jgi:hypothetical protein